MQSPPNYLPVCMTAALCAPWVGGSQLSLLVTAAAFLAVIALRRRCAADSFWAGNALFVTFSISLALSIGASFAVGHSRPFPAQSSLQHLQEAQRLADAYSDETFLDAQRYLYQLEAQKEPQPAE